MLDKFLQFNNPSNSVLQLKDALRQGMPSAVFGVPESFKNYLVSTIEKPVLYVVKDYVTAMNAVRDIKDFSDKSAVYIPPRDETLIFAKAFSKDSVFARLEAISKIKETNVIIVTAQALMQTLCTSVKTLSVSVNDQTDLEQIIKTLVSCGYERCEGLSGKGQFCVRGVFIAIPIPVDSTACFTRKTGS